MSPVPGRSHPPELPLDGGLLRLAVIDLLLVLLSGWVGICGAFSPIGLGPSKPPGGEGVQILLIDVRVM